MKIKRTVAILLVAVMLLVPVSVSVFAADPIMTAGSIKVAYKDTEYFNPQGIEVDDNGTVVAYTPGNEDFFFVPALDEHLTADTTEVAVYYKNRQVGSVSITVEHIWGEIKYLDNNYHGRFCLGCGVVEERLAHNVSEFIPNDDGGFFTDQTETGICLDCGEKITQDIPGTSRFNFIFDFNNMTETEVTVLGYIAQILLPLIQMLVGLK